MKELPILKGASRLAALCAVLLVCQTIRAATFTLSPAAVSNTYTGAITLQITGIPAGDTVVVQKYLDLNANGVIDGNDWMVQQFQMTDGRPGMVIGGVTNINVPGDTDGATNGQIAATLNFFNGDFMQNVVGQYLFKVSSPSNHFAALTNPLTVTNFPFAQQITGTVVTNGAAFPNALVLLLTGQKGKPQAGTVANNLGNYSILVPPGTYMPVPFASNYVVSFGGAPAVTLTNTQTVSTNLMLTNATAAISGQMVDANNSALGLPGVLLTAQSSSGYMGVAFTDSNGNFTVGVQSGQWGIQADDTAVIIHGYMSSKNRTNIDAGATGVILATPKATALLYGSVHDIIGSPMAGLDVRADDDSGLGLYECSGYTDANGNYVVGVLGLGNSDSWWEQVDTSDGPANYIFTQSQFSGDITNGTAVPQNFTGAPATNQISGYLKDSNGSPISGVGVGANATIGGIYFQLETVDTDSTGYYALTVANSNSWSVWVLGGNNNDSLPTTYLDPDNVTLGITNNNPLVNFTALQAPYVINGVLMNTNGNPISNVGINATATNISGSPYNLNAQTDGNGNFSFNVANGFWYLSVNCGQLAADNYQCPGNVTVDIAGASVMTNFIAQACGGLQILTTNVPPGQANASYGPFWLGASSCNPNVTWSLVNNVGLPPGLYLTTNGEIYGTPASNASGNYDFTVQAMNGNGNTASQYLSLYIAPASSPLQIGTSWLPNATNGGFYSQFLQCSGGQPPYSWSLSNGSASLPPGLTLTTNGVLSGIPSTNGTFNFIVQVFDSASTNASQSLALTIVGPALQITTVSLPNATQNAAYRTTLSAWGGQPPYLWSLAPGSAKLPGGLSLGTNGVISGTAGNSGTTQFIARVIDSASTTNKQVLSLTVVASTNAPIITITGASRLAGGEFQFNFNSASGTDYTIEYSTNLVNWTPILILSGSGGSETVIDPNATGGQRFYRVMVEP
jgi:hypothetical protein